MHQQAFDIARQLLRIPSLTPINGALQAGASEALDLLQRIAAQTGASCHRLSFEGGHDVWGYAVDNLYVTWPGQADRHLCFLGHLDVVPPGDLTQWRRDPFSGDVDGGMVWGRGATDMKGAVAAFCAAAIGFASQRPAQRPTVSMILTADEEWAAVNGTRKVLEWLRDRGVCPNAFLVGEPSSPSRLGTHLKIGRRGSLCGTLTAHGVQGHAAYPELFVNPNRILAAALDRLHAYEWGDARPGMPPTSFETIALRSGDFGQTAIVPSTAEALWNIRFTPSQTVEELVVKLRNLLALQDEATRNAGAGGNTPPLSMNPNTSSVSMPYYSPPGAFAHLAAEAVQAVTGHHPVFDAGGGTTDARFVHAAFPGAEIVELGLPEAGGGGAAGEGGMHQVNECCSIADLAALTDCYAGILARFGNADDR